MRTGSDSNSLNEKPSGLSAQGALEEEDWQVSGRGEGERGPTGVPRNAWGTWSSQGTTRLLRGSLNPTQIMRRVSSLPREKGRCGQSQDLQSTWVCSEHYSARCHSSPITPSASCLSPHGGAGSWKEGAGSLCTPGDSINWHTGSEALSHPLLPTPTPLLAVLLPFVFPQRTCPYLTSDTYTCIDLLCLSVTYARL